MQCSASITTTKLQIIRSEYLEMPGLVLTKPQIERLWALDPTESSLVINALVGAGFLRCTPESGYLRVTTDIDPITSKQ
jgi:hypothetical protein